MECNYKESRKMRGNDTKKANETIFNQCHDLYCINYITADNLTTNKYIRVFYIFKNLI